MVVISNDEKLDVRRAFKPFAKKLQALRIIPWPVGRFWPLSMIVNDDDPAGGSWLDWCLQNRLKTIYWLKPRKIDRLPPDRSEHWIETGQKEGGSP